MSNSEIFSPGGVGNRRHVLEERVNLQRERADVIVATPIREAIGAGNLQKLNEEFGAGSILRVTAALATDDIIPEEDTAIWDGIASAIEEVGGYGN